MEIRVVETALDGVLIVETEFVRDERGFFIESYHRQRYVERGLGQRFVQDNHSRSARGVLRGLHYQNLTAPMGKLVRCSFGAIWDVAVDLRVGSPTFGKWVGMELSDENLKQLLIPAEFAHGFVVLSASADVQYKCTGYYTSAAEGTIAWDDPQLAIEWPVDDPSLSQRDRNGTSLAAYTERPAFRHRP